MLFVLVTLVSYVSAQSAACDACSDQVDQCLFDNCSDFLVTFDMNCIFDNCDSAMADEAQCKQDNQCTDEDGDCYQCAVVDYESSKCILQNCDLENLDDLSCYFNDCYDQWEDSMLCQYENGCEEGACDPACNQALLDVYGCAVQDMDMSGDETEDDSLDSTWEMLTKCSSENDKFIDCQYNHCIEDYDVSYTMELCKGENCNNCVYVEASAISYNSCELNDEDTPEDGSEIMSCVNNQICSEWFADTVCATTSEETNCYDNSRCQESDEAGYQMRYTWYDGCGATSFEGASASSALFIAMAFLVQVFAW